MICYVFINSCAKVKIVIKMSFMSFFFQVVLSNCHYVAYDS